MRCICFLTFIALFSCQQLVRQDPARPVYGTTRLPDAAVTEASWDTTDQLVVHFTAEPDNLHPTNGSSSQRSEINLYTQASIVQIDLNTGRLIPSLVERLPEPAQNGTEFVYHLRRDVRWDDGTPLQVEDIVFTAKANKCPLTMNPAVKVYWNNVAAVEPLPDDTSSFRVILKKPNIQNVSFLSGFPVMQRKFHDPDQVLSGFSFSQLEDPGISNPALSAWAETFNDDRYGRDPRYLNGLGTYKVIRWEPGQSILLERKSGHWSGTPSGPRRILFRVIRDENAQVLEFRSQQLDLSTTCSMGAFLSLQSDPELRKHYRFAVSPTYNYTYLCFNLRPDSGDRKALFTDMETRHALALMTPVDRIIRLIYSDYAPACHRMAGNVSALKAEFDTTLQPVPFDPSRGRALLRKAGWEDADGDGVLERKTASGTISFEAELAYLNVSPDWRDIALMIRDEWARAGIRLRLVPMELKRFQETARSHRFDLLLGSWSATSQPEDYGQLWGTAAWLQHGSNFSGFGTQETDALIDSIRQSVRLEDYNRLSHRLQRTITNTQPMIFLYASLRRVIVHKRYDNAIIFPERPGIRLDSLHLSTRLRKNPS